MNGETLRRPLALQLGAVIALFVAAVVTLWYTSTLVLRREERRILANDRLKEATDLLISRGRGILEGVRPYPQFMEPGEWDAIDRRLTEAARAVRSRYPDIEGGYYVPDRHERPFLPALPDAGAVAKGPSQPLVRNVYDYVETQADAAYRKKYALLVVEDIPPDAVAIRAAPITAGSRIVATSWAMSRLVDPIFHDRPATGYRIFAGLSLAGIALSSALTFNLVRTIRRQAAERDRLQLELRRSERLAALGKLLAGVAHEVRNPLAGIRSTAQLWQRGLGLDPESLAGLIREVDRLEEIVSSLLQFSRADAQDLAPGDLNAVVAEAARLAAPQADAKGIRLVVELAHALPPVLMTAPAVLQIFRNLTINAIQAMPLGGTLRLTTRSDEPRHAVVAFVADTGPGMTPETIGHLFEPFFTTKAEGTGLGLAIAREIALSHRGDLHAANRSDGPGAVFSLTLPAAPEGDR